jgi:hypothetical protein
MSTHTAPNGVTYLDQPYDQRIKLLPWQRAGLTYTATGYGRKIPSRWQIRIKGESRWRRVYVTQYSNTGTTWIRYRGQDFVVVRDLEG